MNKGSFKWNILNLKPNTSSNCIPPYWPSSRMKICFTQLGTTIVLILKYSTIIKIALLPITITQISLRE